MILYIDLRCPLGIVQKLRNAWDGAKIGYGHGWSNTSLMLATGQRETMFDCNTAMIILWKVNKTELRKIVYDAEDRKGSGLQGEMS